MTKRFVFIGGLHRSGTTALAAALGRHPAISALSATGVIEDEGQFLQSVYPFDTAFGGAGRFAFHSHMHMTERDLPADPEGASRELIDSWSPYWDLSKPVLLEKSPANCLKARYLAGLFGDCRFIFLTRHPVAVSLATRKWSHTGPFALLSHWIAAHRVMREDFERVNHCAIVSYEELTSKPGETLSRLLRFVGVEERDLKPSLTGGLNERYFRVWSEAYAGAGHRFDLPSVRSGRASACDLLMARVKANFWRSAFAIAQVINAEPILTRREVVDAMAATEETVNEFGYSLYRLNEYPELMIKCSSNNSALAPQ